MSGDLRMFRKVVLAETQISARIASEVSFLTWSYGISASNAFMADSAWSAHGPCLRACMPPHMHTNTSQFSNQQTTQSTNGHPRPNFPCETRYTHSVTTKTKMTT